MTTLDDLLTQKRHLVTVIIMLENKDRLGHEGLDALWKARNELWDVERQITEKNTPHNRPKWAQPKENTP